MELIKWDDKFAFGLEDIDEEHKRLFELINDLITAKEKSENKSIAIQLGLEFLENYVVSHFENEEETFDQTDYPEKDAHKKLHEELKRQVQSYKSKFAEHGEEVIDDLIKFSTNWLTHHILEVDRKYVEFCIEKNIGVTSRYSL